MRTREEVLNEIEWREKEIDRLSKTLTADNETEEYNRWRIQNLNTAILWCKWFLKEKAV